MDTNKKFSQKYFDQKQKKLERRLQRERKIAANINSNGDGEMGPGVNVAVVVAPKDQLAGVEPINSIIIAGTKLVGSTTTLGETAHNSPVGQVTASFEQLSSASAETSDGQPGFGEPFARGGQLRFVQRITTHAADQDAIAPKDVPQFEQQLPEFTEEENQKILGFLNENINVQDFMRYEISKVRANKLLAWKTRNGSLKRVEDILLVEGFGLKVVEKFYRSLLADPTSTDATKGLKRQRTAPFITPSIEVEHQQSIKSCVAVRIGVSSVTWARIELPPPNMNAPCALTHWQHHDITEKKLHLNDLVQRCFYLNYLIPTADCYIFENPQMAQASNNPGNVEQQNVNIQKSQITAVLSFALSARNNGLPAQSSFETTMTTSKRSGQPNVFYLRRLLAARLFNNLVGTERVSSEQTIMDLMRTYYNIEEQPEFRGDTSACNAAGAEQIAFRGNIQFPNDLRQMFAGAERYQREFMGQALLLNLAFIRLVLIQDNTSIAIVSRASNKDDA